MELLLEPDGFILPCCLPDLLAQCLLLRSVLCLPCLVSVIDQCEGVIGDPGLFRLVLSGGDVLGNAAGDVGLELFP